MSRDLTCSECGGKMQRGLVIDTQDNHGFLDPARLDTAYWVEGKSERNILGGIKVRKKEKYYITAFRCEGCGFLKLYAGPDLTSKK
jgi:hypothetical protein